MLAARLPINSTKTRQVGRDVSLSIVATQRECDYARIQVIRRDAS
jgi:hypothetical protein